MLYLIKTCLKPYAITIIQNCKQNETVVSISEITSMYTDYEENCHLCDFPFCIFNLFRILIIRIYVAKTRDQS